MAAGGSRPGKFMPLYEYECLKCGERFELIQKFSDDLLKLHIEYAGSTCDGSVRKLLAAPAIKFKGTGWYVTDYGKGGKKPEVEAGASSDKKDASVASKSGDKSKPTKPKAKTGPAARAPATSLGQHQKLARGRRHGTR